MEERYRIEFEDRNGSKCEVWFTAPAFWVVWPDFLRKRATGEVGNLHIYDPTGRELTNLIPERQPAPGIAA